MAARVNIRQLENVGGPGFQLISKQDGSWGVQSVSASKTYTYVDPINGDNAIAQVGSKELPFKDPWAAKDAIEALPSSEEYTLFWLPGHYTVGDDANNLKVIASTAEGNLHSNTHVINHYLFRGAQLEIVTDSISVSLFIVATGSNNKIRILGEGSIYHDRTAQQGLLGSFLNDSGLAAGERTDIVIKADKVELSGATFGTYINILRNSDIDIEVGSISNSNVQTLVQVSPNSTVSQIETNFKLKADRVDGSQDRLVQFAGNAAATQGVIDSTIDIDLGVNISAVGPLVNFYRTLFENSIVKTKITGTASRGGASGALVNIHESPAVESVINIDYEGLITDLDTITRIDTVATEASPHPSNSNQITVNIKGLIAQLSGSQGTTPLINYIYNSAQVGTKVDIHVDAVLEDRLFFTLRENQDVTISGNIKSNGTASPILIGEALTDDANYKKLLKDLFIDAATPIDVNGYTGSEIYTANYTDRNSVTVTTL